MSLLSPSPSLSFIIFCFIFFKFILVNEKKNSAENGEERESYRDNEESTIIHLTFLSSLLLFLFLFFSFEYSAASKK